MRITHHQEGKDDNGKEFQIDQRRYDRVEYGNYLGTLPQQVLIFEGIIDEYIFLQQQHRIFHIGKEIIARCIVIRHHHCITEQFQT